MEHGHIKGMLRGVEVVPLESVVANLLIARRIAHVRPLRAPAQQLLLLSMVMEEGGSGNHELRRAVRLLV
jgi:hypothetical protein